MRDGSGKEGSDQRDDDSVIRPTVLTIAADSMHSDAHGFYRKAQRMNPDRLAELATLDPGDTPDDARIVITAGDLRDLVSLLPVVHAAILARGTMPDSTYNEDLREALVAAGLAR